LVESSFDDPIKTIYFSAI